MTTTALFRWDGLDATAVAQQFGLPYVEMLAEVESTLDLAHQRASDGVPAGALIVADAQRAGRGRMGRSWSSMPRRGVWCTLVERPDDAAALDVLSIRVGMEVARRLEPLAGRGIGVKWPNDLVIDGRKLGGILAEARWSGGRPAWVAVGVGVNVVPPDGVDQAIAMPEGVRRVDVLSAIVRGVREAASRSGHLSDAELKAFAERDILIGRHLRAPGVGIAEGISSAGALLVRAGQHVEHHRAGTVQFAD